MTWKSRYINLCAHISQWSKDPSTKVGAVIADGRKRIVSLGFNGLPSGVEDEEEILNNKELKYPRIVHAEANAILNAQRSLERCTLYVYPLPPCSECAKMIIQVGISQVVYDFPETVSADKWKKDFEISQELFKKAGVKVERL